MSEPDSPEIRDDLTISLRPFLSGQAQGAGAQAGRSYLLVLEGSSSSTFDLPQAGEVIIGRSQEAQLRVEDSSASRRHARLVITSRDAVLMDLGSHNGTRVNGERLSGPRVLTSGDVISICNVTLVFHRDARAVLGRAILDQGQLRQRLEEESDRALRYRRPLGLVCLRLAGEGGPADRRDASSIDGRGRNEGGERERAQIPRLLEGQLRLIDAIGWDGPAQLMLLLPEVDPAEVAECAAQLVRMLAPLGVAVHVGYATCPGDGDDADTLLAGARAAALLSAQRGAPCAATEAATTLDIGGRAIVMADPAMVRLYALIEKLAQSDLPVLITGETGAGKEIAAAAIHNWSRRKDRPLVTLNCAALPENLIESELFGHDKGAFSGAVAAKVGLLESASGGTVFLDELGELPLAAQAKLLRVLETQRLTRLGEVRERAIDIRLVAATNRDLGKEVSAGRFRQDLFFRLSVARIVLPPLRDRRRELPVLARTLLAEACRRLGREPMTISPAAMQRLLAHRWPGNVRELKNLMEYVAATAPEQAVEAWQLAEHMAATAQVGGGAGAAAEADEAGAPPRPAVPLPTARRSFRPIDEEVRELERTRMAEALEAAGGVQVRAAELISMPMRTFATKVKQYNLLPQKRRDVT